MTISTSHSGASANESLHRRGQSLRVLCWVMSGVTFLIGPLIGMTVNAELGAAIWVSSAVLALLPFSSHRNLGPE